MRRTPAGGNKPVPTHQPFPNDRAYRKAEKNKADQEVYDQRWRKISRTYLAHNPLCVMCFEQGILTEAKHSDHIKNAKAYPELRYDESNLRPLCIPCHSTITAKDQHAKGKR